MYLSINYHFFDFGVASRVPANPGSPYPMTQFTRDLGATVLHCLAERNAAAQSCRTCDLTLHVFTDMVSTKAQNNIGTFNMKRSAVRIGATCQHEEYT